METLILIVVCVVAFAAGYFIGKPMYDGLLHVVYSDEEEPYIFMEAFSPTIIEKKRVTFKVSKTGDKENESKTA